MVTKILMHNSVVTCDHEWRESLHDVKVWQHFNRRFLMRALVIMQFTFAAIVVGLY